MVVIGDACTINYLLRANCYQDVYKMYGEIIVPEKVKQELRGTPEILEMQMIMSPLKVMKVNSVEDINLDPGETEAIALYKEINADLFLTDDIKARNYCTNNNINVKNFIGIIKDLRRIQDISEIKRIVMDSGTRLFTHEIFKSISEV